MFVGKSVQYVEEHGPGCAFREQNITDITRKSVESTSGRISGCRFELKYHITESKAAEIVQFISSFVHLDKYCKLQPSGYYPIVSLYLDSEDLHLCRESLVGIKNRFKLRIRSYTDDIYYPRFLEIKRRMNSIIIKSRAQIMDPDIKALLTGRPVPGRSDINEERSINQFQLYMNTIRARPVALVRYMRRAYEDDFHNRLRITLDRELTYKVTSVPEVSLGGQEWRRHSYTVGGVVLEVKFTGHYPAWLDRMIRCFDLRQESISKYVSSIRESCLLKFCAPRIGTF